VEGAHFGLYLVASLALIATPGQDMLYVISRSLAQGPLAGVCSAVGVCLGILVHTALAAFGVGAILLASEGLFLAMKLLGSAYLAYLGVLLLAYPKLKPAQLAPYFGHLLLVIMVGLLSGSRGNTVMPLLTLAIMYNYLRKPFGIAAAGTMVLVALLIVMSLGIARTGYRWDRGGGAWCGAKTATCSIARSFSSSDFLAVGSSFCLRRYRR
jgi:threonine/homoserine/homoserine lactone efflux protein